VYVEHRGWVGGGDVGVDFISRGRDRCLVSSLRNVERFLRAERGDRCRILTQWEEQKILSHFNERI